MGAFGAPTEKPTTFWSNHRDWLLMLVREMTKEDRQRIEELAVRLTIRKFAACLQCQVAYMLVPYVIHGSSRHTHTRTHTLSRTLSLSLAMRSCAFLLTGACVYIVLLAKHMLPSGSGFRSLAEHRQTSGAETITEA